ncbi:MAG: hypothetical protein MJ000_10540 [Bacteroidales bacterium]|nr:hypothetical protein [Bacteroidales bacterium]
MKNKLLLLLLLTTTLLRGADVNVTDHIEILAQTAGSAIIKSDIPVSASIDGHALTIYINENVGIAHIVVTNSNGVYIDRDNILHTPDDDTHR